MKWLALFVVLATLYQVNQAVLPSIFAGDWTDPYHGGVLSICTAGNLLYGTYSGLGYIKGNITIDTSGNAIASGQWVEAGYTDKTSGDFQFVLLNGASTFTGTKITSYFRCAPADWQGTRVNFNTTLPACMPIFQQVVDLFTFDDFYNYTIQGTWRNDAGDSLSICFRDDTVHATFTGNQAGFSSGRSHFLGVVARMSYRSLSFKTPNAIQLFVLGDPNPSSQSNNGTKLYVYTISGVSSASTVNVSGFNGVSVVEWTRTNLPDSVPTGSCRAYITTNVDMAARWNGAWTDWDFGFGRFYLCTDGLTVHGLFSELGWVTGFMRGDGNSIYGRFYDAGDTEQVSGDFDLHLDQDNDHFDGWWRFDNSAKKYVWNASRISVNKPTNDQCLAVVPNINGRGIASVWRYDSYSSRDTLDICFLQDDLTRFEASYNFNGNQERGYFSGQVRENERALQGIWYENGKSGIALMVLSSDNVLHYIRWNHADIQAASYFQCDGSVGNTLWVRHRNVAFTQRVNTVNNTCSRNRDLGNFLPAGPFTPAGFIDNYELQYQAMLTPKRPTNVVKRGIDGQEDELSAASRELSTVISLLAVVLIAAVVMLV